MVLEISSAALQRILACANASPAREVCGLLFGAADRIEHAEPCANVADDPRTSFEIDPAHLIAAHRGARGGGLAVAGCYHSHPNGSPLPSARDAAAAAPDGSIWLIVARGEARCYRAVENGKFDAVEYRVVLLDLAIRGHSD